MNDDRLKFRLPAINTKNGYVRMSYFDLAEATGMASPTFLPYWEVRPIEQSTGIRDRNGRLIYEGDIVKADAYVKPFRVEWNSERLRYVAAWSNGHDFLDDMGILFPDRLEGVVIGNIHENPKLVGESV